MKKERTEKKYTRSFAHRLTWRIVLAMLLTMGLVSYTIYKVSLRGIRMYQTSLYQSNLSEGIQSVRRILSDLHVASINNASDIKDHLSDPNEMHNIVERMLKNNKHVRSCGISFIENYYPQKARLYQPYIAHVRRGKMIKSEIGSDGHDYLQEKWFTDALDANKGFWSDPFLEQGDTVMPLVSYLLPIHDKSGKAVAVLGADLSLDWLSKKMAKLDKKIFFNSTPFNTYDYDYNEAFLDADEMEEESVKKEFDDDDDDIELFRSFCFLIDSNGTFLAHPEHDIILKKSVFDYTRLTPDSTDDKLAADMVAGGRSTGKRIRDLRININEREYVLLYAPVKFTNWSMGMVVPSVAVDLWAYTLSIFFAILIITALVVLYFVSKHVIRSVTKPLTRFANSADQIAQGNLTTELPEIKSHDELRMLYDSFSTMQTSLVKQIEDMRVANEEKGRIKSELDIASKIQMAMLPKKYPAFPERDDIDIYGMVTPAKEIGGDLYDFFLRDEKLFFCIGDVSGKGVPASLVMCVVRSLFRNIAQHSAEPERIVQALNRSLTDNNESDMFVTMFIGVLDLPTGRLRYCNAGHDAPILIGDNGIGRLPCEPNLPVGVISDFRYVPQDTIISTYTTIFLFTDGLTEAENIHHEQFQDDRVMQVASTKERKPYNLLASMSEAVKEFVGDAEQSDDLTMMAIQYSHVHEKDHLLNRSLTLPNDIEEVPQLAVFVDEVCEAVGFDMSTAMSLNLAMEEAVVNVMSYAYPTGTKGDVVIEAKANEKRLKFIISDNGKPFDPTTKSEVDTTLPAEERPIGGLGIHLVRQIMDSINYERLNGKNILTLRKKLTRED